MAVISTSKLITIDRHISMEENLHPEATGAFTNILHDWIFAIRLISKEVRRAGLNDILGLTENTNVHGERVRKIDQYANDVINRSMYHSGQLCAMISEESVGLIPIPEAFKKGKYILAFDPLDGSTNIDVNITIGTIFSLYKRLDSFSTSDVTMTDILQPGIKQVAAGYVLYGSSTIFAYTTGHGLNIFTYDPIIGEFLLTFENIKMPKKGFQYSCNEGNYYKWNQRVQDFVNHIKTPTNNSKPFTLRYIATAVADIHRMLHYGGVYLYPAETNMPNGKIRLLYEASPLAMIVEQAGGKAITGTQRILDVVPTSIHQTVPFFVGSEENINELEKYLKGEY